MSDQNVSEPDQEILQSHPAEVCVGYFNLFLVLLINNCCEVDCPFQYFSRETQLNRVCSFQNGLGLDMPLASFNSTIVMR